MWPRRIAFAIVLLLSALCLGLTVVVLVSFRDMEKPERYFALGFGLLTLYMGGSLLVSLIWPSKPKDPNAPIQIPPLDQVRGRTSYRDDSTMSRNVMLVIGAIFLAASLSAAPGQPIVLVIAAIAVGVLAGAGVMIWRQVQYGRARLELDAPARRGDPLRAVITTSGSAWAKTGHALNATFELIALQTFRAHRYSELIVIARASGDIAITRDGDDITFRITTTIPVIDTSDGRFSWNVQLETRSPKYRPTFLIDVA